MNGTGESGFYSVDGFPTVYRRNYLKISVRFQLSCGAKQKEMVVIDPVSGRQKNVASLQAIAISLDGAEILKQYGPKRDKGDVTLLQRQFTMPQDLHNSRVSYNRIQFKTAGKGSSGSSNSHKMAITKARIRFELYAQVENNEPEILVSSLSSQILALRGRSQKYYDNLDDTFKKQVLQMLYSPFRPRSLSTPQPAMSSFSSTSPVITESLFGEFQRSPMFNPSVFQTSTINGYSGSFHSAAGFCRGNGGGDYLDSPAGSVLSPLDSLLSPASTTMAFSPFSFDMTFSNDSSSSSVPPYDSFQFQPLGGSSQPFLPKQQQQQKQQQQRIPDLSQEEFNPLEVSPDCVLSDFFKGETMNAASMPFFGSFTTSTSAMTAAISNKNQQQQYACEFPTPASTTASSGAPSPAPFGIFSRPAASVPLQTTANKHHHISFSAKSFLKIDTRIACFPNGAGNSIATASSTLAAQQQLYSPYLRFKSPLSAQMPVTAFDFGKDLGRVKSAPPLDVGFDNGGFC